MAITYNVGTNTITVTGYTEVTPCTFLDVYNADIAGSWGVVTRQCISQYCIDAKLIIGDGSIVTWFADEDQQIIFPGGIISANYQTIFGARNNAHLRLGKLESASLKTTSNGVSIMHLESTYVAVLFGYYGPNEYPYLELYGCSITTKNQETNMIRDATSLKTYQCTFIGNWVSLEAVTTADVSRLTILKGWLAYPDCVGNDIYVSDGTYGLYGGGAIIIFTLKNITIRNASTSSFGFNFLDAYNYIVNGDVDNWTFTWNNPRPNGRLYRQYEFDLKVQDKDGNAINGATVKIWDKDNNLVVNTTTASGVIATQTLTYGYYNYAGGNTPTMQTPHKIQIRKSGTNYLTYETDFTIDKKTGWVIMMVDMSDLIDEINANEVKIDAIEAKLDSPDNFKADVSDLAKEVSVDDVKVRIDDLIVFGAQKQ